MTSVIMPQNGKPVKKKMDFMWIMLVHIISDKIQLSTCKIIHKAPLVGVFSMSNFVNAMIQVIKRNTSYIIHI